MKCPSKCPVCNSSQITMNPRGDISCKKCGYTRLSTTTINEKVALRERAVEFKS